MWCTCKTPPLQPCARCSAVLWHSGTVLLVLLLWCWECCSYCYGAGADTQVLLLLVLLLVLLLLRVLLLLLVLQATVGVGDATSTEKSIPASGAPKVHATPAAAADESTCRSTQHH